VPVKVVLAIVQRDTPSASTLTGPAFLSLCLCLFKPCVVDLFMSIQWMEMQMQGLLPSSSEVIKLGLGFHFYGYHIPPLFYTLQRDNITGYIILFLYTAQTPPHQ
jgi:hypothetical protein